MSYLMAQGDAITDINNMFGLNDPASSIAAAQAASANFSARWQSEIIPALRGSNRVPAQFVIDVVQSLIDNVTTPIANIQQPLATRAALLGAGGPIVGSGLTDAAMGVVNEILQVSTLANFLEQQKLAPIAAQAKQIRAAGGKTAMMAIDITGPDRFDYLVTQTLDAGVAAFAELQRIGGALDEGISGLLGDVMVKWMDYLETQGKAIESLAQFLKDIAHNIYNTVVGFGELIDFMIKGTLVLAGAYVAWEIFKPKQQQNPARRRRRRRRR